MNDNFDVIINNGQIIDLNAKEGWVCPKCGGTVSPAILVCPICGGKRTNEDLNPGESIICG